MRSMGGWGVARTSPIVCSQETREAGATPHPALRATFSRKWEKENHAAPYCFPAPCSASQALSVFFGAILRNRRSRKLRSDPGCRVAMRARTEG
jgi:hypothetical protein